VRTDHAFTVVVCVGCSGWSGDSWLDELRAVVRLYPHGMLVSAACLLGSSFCRTRPGAGAIAILQPCTVDRVPSAPASWIGPITDEADVADFCDWIMQGEWNLEGLPVRLQSPLRQLSHASRKN
jgi:hypothetical protein